MADVLIVDDDASIRAIIDTTLHAAGFACQQAADGDEALRHLRASKGRLVVLLDQKMTGMSGQDVLEAVAADPHRLGHHAYILLTAASNTLPQAFLYLLDQLDVAVIAKPFDIGLLVEIVTGAAEALHTRQQAVLAPQHQGRAERVVGGMGDSPQQVPRRSRGGG